MQAMTIVVLEGEGSFGIASAVAMSFGVGKETFSNGGVYGVLERGCRGRKKYSAHIKKRRGEVMSFWNVRSDKRSMRG